VTPWASLLVRVDVAVAGERALGRHDRCRMVLLGSGGWKAQEHSENFPLKTALANECFRQLNGLSDRLPRCRLWTDIRTGDFGCYRKSGNLCGRRPTGRV
jgi:hypothetical protein